MGLLMWTLPCAVPNIYEPFWIYQCTLKPCLYLTKCCQILIQLLLHRLEFANCVSVYSPMIHVLSFLRVEGIISSQWVAKSWRAFLKIDYLSLLLLLLLVFFLRQGFFHTQDVFWSYHPPCFFLQDSPQHTLEPWCLKRNNLLSQVCISCMHIGVGPSSGSWAAH